MKTVVTGGAGFIGSHLARRLLTLGHDVHVLDSLDPRVHPRGALAPAGTTFHHADVRDAEALARAVTGADVIFHHAAMVGLGRGAADAAAFLDVNATATATLVGIVHARAPRARIVLASTMALYGEGAYSCPACGGSTTMPRSKARLDAHAWDPMCAACGATARPRAITEDHPPRPRTPYAVSKLAQEQVAFAMADEVGVEVVALRYHNAYGPGMPRGTPYAGVASFYKDALLRGEAPLVHEDGAQVRDFVHVDDLVQANLRAAEADVAGHAFNIGSGEPHPVLDLAGGLCDELAPHLAPRLPGTYRIGDARHVFASIEHARKRLGYEPTVGFHEGVRRFAREPAREAPEVRS